MTRGQRKGKTPKSSRPDLYDRVWGPFSLRLSRAITVLELFRSSKDHFAASRKSEWTRIARELARDIAAARGGEQPTAYPGVTRDPRLWSVFARRVKADTERLICEDLEHAEYAVNSAAAMLVHSAVDDALLALIREIAKCHPLRCFRFVADREVPLQLVAKRGFDSVCAERVERWAAEFDRQSLLAKAETIQSLFEEEDMPRYIFKNLELMPVLGRLNTVRHEAVHKEVCDFSRIDLHDSMVVLARGIGMITMWIQRALEYPYIPWEDE